MGLFSGGGFFGSGGKTTSSTSNTQTVTTQQTASELENSNAIFGSDNQITYTDYGAISEASALAQTALHAGMEQQQLGAELSYRTSQLFSEESNRALESVADFGARFGAAAFSTVENALGQVSRGNSESLETLSRFGDLAISANSDARRDALSVSQYALESSLSAANAARVDSLQASSITTAGALDAVTNIFRDSFTGITSFIRDLQGQSSEQIGSTVTALNTIAKEQNTSADQRVADISTNAIKYVVIGLGLLAVAAAGVYAIKGK